MPSRPPRGTVATLVIEERREQRAQRQSDQFAAVVRELLAALALTPDQQARVPGATRAAVAALLAQPGVMEQPENRPGLGRGRP